VKKITVLILMANPSTTETLGLEKELGKILEALNQSPGDLKFEVISCYTTSTNRLHDEFRRWNPQIVHFSGHGAGEKGLVFEDEAKQIQFANAKALSGLFELFECVECVILNACYSEIQAEEIHKSINCVIGMKQAIGDKAAIEFASGFYKSLKAGDSFERAYKFGLNAIDFVNSSESSTPVMKIKKHDAVPTLKPNLQPEPEPRQDTTSSSKGDINANINVGRDSNGQILIGNSNTANHRSSEVR